MKLRNKKTGHVGEFDIECIKERGDFLKVVSNDAPYYEIKEECGNLYYYDTLAEFNNDWEDYKPAEPLIKDEKIRKAVRAWAEAFGVTNAYVGGIGDDKDYIELYAQDNGVTDGRIRMSISTQNGVWISKEYTITELCGEEEE